MEKQKLQDAVSPLLAWYRVCKRDLPWRKARTFYSVLVSELMLQQTRVEAVKERYVQFLQRFPAPEALAGGVVIELTDWQFESANPVVFSFDS